MTSLAEPVESSLSGCADTARSGLVHRPAERLQIGKPDAVLMLYLMSLLLLWVIIDKTSLQAVAKAALSFQVAILTCE